MALEEYLCFTNADSYPDMRGKCQFYKLDLDTKFGILLLLLQNSGASVNQIRTKTKSQLEETKGKESVKTKSKEQNEIFLLGNLGKDLYIFMACQPEYVIKARED